MRILQIIQRSQLRGAEIFAAQLSNHLADIGCEVKIVAIFQGGAVLPFGGEIIYLGRSKKSRFFDFYGWWQFSKLVKRFKPDIIQANAGDTLKFCVLSKQLFGWKSQIVFRNANKVSDFVDGILKKKINQWLLSRVDHIVSVSELCRKDIISTYRYSPNRTTTVSIGVELIEIEPIPKDIEMLLDGSDFLINVASFVPEKNHVGLIRIFRKILAEFPGIKLVLVGGGKLRQEIERAVKVNNLKGHIFFVGNKERREVLGLMAGSKGLLLPSLIEGLPGVILEAMYCKVPVVAYNVGGISEVVVSGITGILVEKEDEKGFVKGVIDLLNGKNNKMIIENAQNLVVNQFDNESIAAQFFNTYKKVVDQEI